MHGQNESFPFLFLTLLYFFLDGPHLSSSSYGEGFWPRKTHIGFVFSVLGTRMAEQQVGIQNAFFCQRDYGTDFLRYPLA